MGRGRILTVALLLVAFFAAAVFRIVDVQATPDARLLRELSIPVYEIEVPAARGTVFDRNGRAIALSLPSATIISNPRLIVDPAATAEALAEVLQIPSEDLIGDLQGDAAYRYVARQVDPELGEAVTALGLDGIRVIKEPRREHPNGDCSALAGVGRVNKDHVGMSGIEQTHEEHLAGEPGRLRKERGARGTTIPGGFYSETPAVVGGDITLTLDRNVQFQTERLLVEAVAGSAADAGVALVAVPSTGEVIAMANAARDSAGILDCTRHNLAATWSYEPGSVVKPVTAAAALYSGAVGENEEIKVPGEMTIWGHTFVDAPSHGTVRMAPAEILSRSSNLGAIVMARRVGEAGLYRTLRSFGVGSRTALQLKGEASGLLPKVRDWNGLSLPNIAIGQGLAVTPLQMLQIYNVIANDGVRMPLKIILGDPAPSAESPKPERVIDSWVAAALMRILTGAVEEGTGRRAAVEGYSVAGKTGTAWQPCDIGYDCVNSKNELIGRHYTATFAGIVSNHDGPALVVLVVIDNPKGERYSGGQLAAPAVARIAEYTLRQLRVPAESAGTPGDRRRAQPAPAPTTSIPTVDDQTQD